MSKLQVTDWQTAPVAAGSRYELVYLVRNPNNANRNKADNEFESILGQRSGVSVHEVESIGSGVVRAIVTTRLQGRSVMATFGQSVWVNVSQPDEVEYKLTNVFLERQGGALDTVFQPVYKVAEAVDLAISGAAINAADTLEDLGLAPRHLALYGAVAVGAFLLWSRR